MEWKKKCKTPECIVWKFQLKELNCSNKVVVSAFMQVFVLFFSGCKLKRTEKNRKKYAVEHCLRWSTWHLFFGRYELLFSTATAVFNYFIRNKKKVSHAEHSHFSLLVIFFRENVSESLSLHVLGMFSWKLNFFIVAIMTTVKCESL